MNRVIVGLFLFLGASLAQTPAEQAELSRFAVASIRPSSPDELGGPSGMQTGRGLVRAVNVTLKRCISGAYEVGEDRIRGGPEWAEYDRFDITAEADQPVGNDVLNVMLRTLLADRFHLVLHRESRLGDTMVLEVAMNGPALQPADDGRASWKNMHDHLEAMKITMGEFAKVLSRDLKLPVVDRTGLTGAYNFTLRWNPADSDALERDEATSALRSEMSRAIARQLRLTLKLRRLPVEILVIDQAQKPSEN